MKSRKERKSVARRAHQYLEANPQLKQALAAGIANLTAVAEKVKGEATPDAGIGAVKAAVRRYAAKAEYLDYCGAVRPVLRRMDIGVRSRMSLVTLAPAALASADKIAQAVPGAFVASSFAGISVLTEETKEAGLIEAAGRWNVRGTERGCFAVLLSAPKEAGAQPGVVALLADSLAKSGISAKEVLAFGSQCIFVFSENDGARAHGIISALAGKD
jgi:hypothetical protein